MIDLLNREDLKQRRSGNYQVACICGGEGKSEGTGVQYNTAFCFLTCCLACLCHVFDSRCHEAT
jgi:hypothetical protein